jgi:predicted aminopeptidase
VAYRGYFSESAAKEYGQRLSDDGFDVAFGGVSAYSTLGRFSDPILNTMMRWSDVELISTMFHELAHQKLYIKGDSEFNESCATAVEDFGTERWLRARGELERLDSADNSLPMRQEMMALVTAAREQLSKLYAEDIDIELKRARKANILNELSANAAARIEASGTNARNWLAAPLNNARLVSLNLYEGRTDAFRKIMEQCENEIECFYRRAEEIAALPLERRAAALNGLTD